MPALVAILASWLGQLFTASVARYIALKLILFTLTVVVLPLVLKGLMDWLVERSLHVISSQTAASGMTSAVWSVGGMAGWLVSTFQIPAIVSVLMGAIAFRFSLRLIPFLGR
jgi:hypothetical protein